MKCPVLLDHYKYGPVSDLETTQITQVTTFLSTTFKQINTIPLQGGLDQQHFSLYCSGLKNPYLVIDSLRMKLEKFWIWIIQYVRVSPSPTIEDSISRVHYDR
jgi:hypothetical protein